MVQWLGRGKKKTKKQINKRFRCKKCTSRRGYSSQSPLLRTSNPTKDTFLMEHKHNSNQHLKENRLIK
jgi:transposase-like protein